MNRRELLQEQYEDAAFALMMQEVAQAEGEAALRLNERLKQDPETRLPEAALRRGERTIQAAFAQRRAHASGRAAARWLTKVAVVAALTAMMGTAALAVSEDLRTAALNALLDVNQQRTQITFSGAPAPQEQAQTEPSPSQPITLDWLPEGYELESEISDSFYDMVSYVSPVDGLIEVSFTRYGPTTTYNVNTEDCTYREVTVQGHPANLYITNESMLKERYQDMPTIWSDLTIYWIDEEQQVIAHITANNVTEDEMIHLAEGVSWGK